MSDVITFEPQPGPQTEFIKCPLPEVFFGGARGGGKSFAVLLEWCEHAATYGQHANGLVIRRELTQLTELVEESKRIFGHLGATFNEQAKTWRFPNGARLRFAYLDADADAQAYQGMSFTRVYVEEIQNFPDPAPLMKLMATLRSAHGVPCSFRATGNPGGPGSSWVRTRYIDPCPTGWKVIKAEYTNPFTDEVVIKERIYIPARVTDNKYLGVEYIGQLMMSGPPAVVAGWLKGDFYAPLEGSFFPEFGEKHIIPPFEIPRGWSRFRAMDYGSATPFAVLWVAVASEDYKSVRPDGSRLTIPRGALVVYRELYGSPNSSNQGLRWTAEQVAEAINEQEYDEPVGRDGRTGIDGGSVLDPSAFAQAGGPSLAERMANCGVRFRRADNKRVSERGAMGGWDIVRQRLVGLNGHPMLYIMATCREFIRTFPQTQYDPNKPEDVMKKGEDHMSDCLRYACMSRPMRRHADDPRWEERYIPVEGEKAPIVWMKGGRPASLLRIWEEEDMYRKGGRNEPRRIT